MKYATLKQQTWIYRRHYPKDVRSILGLESMKQSLKTGDIKVAQERVAEINVRFDDIVRRVRSGLEVHTTKPDWAKDMKATLNSVDWTPVAFADLRKSVPLGDLAPTYLRMKGKELERSSYKSLRYSVNLFVSRHKDTLVASISRQDGKVFLQDTAKLSASLGKSPRYHGWSLDALLRASKGRGDPITVVTQKRVWAFVKGFLDWVMQEGHLDTNPLQAVRFEGKGRYKSYLVPKNDEVALLLAQVADPRLRALLLLCLLTGMRLGEARGLHREDILDKGNLGLFVKIRPNDLRSLKTEAAERGAFAFCVVPGAG